MATLTYVYADSTAVVGPLATQAEPHSYDLCNQHAHRLTVPRGWEVVRFEGEFPPPQPSSRRPQALAEAVREAGRADRPVELPPRNGPPAAAATCACCPARPRTDPPAPSRPGTARPPVRPVRARR